MNKPTLIAALPMVTPLNITGRETSRVFNETFEGFCRVVIRGAMINWLPSTPPLPVTVTLSRPAVPPNESRPKNIFYNNQGTIYIKKVVPFRDDETSKGMPEMGMSPIDVLAVTSAEPLKPSCTEPVLVTAENSCSNATLFNDLSGWFWKDISRFAKFPVETPPFAGSLGS